MQLVARRYDNAQPVRVEIEGDRIRSVTSAAATPQQAQRCPWIAPGLIDIQVNGYDGQEFSSQELTAEKVAAIVRRHYAFGVTGICPTLTTNGFAALQHGMRAIASACRQDAEIGRRVVGIHLEGPYMSREDGPRGAHPLEHCRRPDWEEFCRLQDAADGRIAILTMSVEFAEAPEFIARATASGVVISIGHTAATGEQIRAAADAGARLSTHLGNGAHRTLRRHPNYLWDQMAEDRLMASIIADGHHLPPEVVKTIVRAKTPAQTILVSDESGLAGLPPGRYQSSGCELEILPDGRLVIAGQDQLLAGASRPIGDGIANVMRFAGVDLATAVGMATRNPQMLLNRPASGLRPGDPADLVLFDLTDAVDNFRTFSVRATLADGRFVYGEG
jgi:N-acetylglucosamine-6-phosphate deacetylase